MQAVGRWGNFFNQELYGPPTNLPWGIAIDCAHRVSDHGTVQYAYPDGRRPFFHPLFLYESISGIVGAFTLLWIARRWGARMRPGDLFFIFLIWYAVVRFLAGDAADRQLDVLRHSDGDAGLDRHRRRLADRARDPSPAGRPRRPLGRAAGTRGGDLRGRRRRRARRGRRRRRRGRGRSRRGCRRRRGGRISECSSASLANTRSTVPFASDREIRRDSDRRKTNPTASARPGGPRHARCLRP